MANNLSSNVSTKVAKVFAAAFESNRVLSKAVDTQFLAGQNGVTNETGDTVYLKRPTQYSAIETADGDISGETKNSIGVGRIAATVQNFITVPLEYPNLEEVTELNQFKEIVEPAAEELANKLELNLGQKMIENAGLVQGTPGEAVDDWREVANAGALATAIGMPTSGEKYYVCNPFTQAALARAQNSLHAGEALVRSAWENAQISANFAGFRVISSNALKTYTSGASTDRAGTLSATPNATWATHKDTMIQTVALTGLSTGVTDAVRAGDVIEFTARYHINVKNRQTVIGADGTPVKFRATVVTGGNTDGGGAVTVTITNAAIYGASGGLDEQYRTVSSALTSGDAFTLLGGITTVYQPNLFFHKKAFALATLSLPRLHATDMMVTSKDGLKMRISQYSDGDKNLQRWRIDMLPVMGIVNPLFIGKGFGTDGQSI